MRMTVVGGRGAWPTPERGCIGYLIEESSATRTSANVSCGYSAVI